MSLIFKIGDAFCKHLRAGLPVTPPASEPDAVSLVDPGEPSIEPCISVWLYHLAPDEFVRNGRPPVLREAAPGRVPATRLRSLLPPLGVNLRYLITPLLGSAELNHTILSHLLLRIHEAPQLAIQDPSLGIDELVNIVLLAEAIEDRLRLWESLRSRPYQLSFSCELRTARLIGTTTLEETVVMSALSAELPAEVLE